MFANRAFRLVFAGHAFSSLGDAMAVVAIVFAVIDLTGKASDVGLVLAAYVLSFVGFVVFGGVIADRIERQRLMIAADLTRLAVQATTAALVISGSAELWHLVVLQAAMGAATAFFEPAAIGLMPMTVPPEDLQEANALRSLALALTGVVGSAASGLLVAAVGAGPSIAIDAVTFAISAGCLSRLRLPEQAHVPREPFHSELVAGWREVRRHTWLWGVITTLSIRNACWSAFAVLGPVIAAQRLGGASAWGLILSAGSAGALIGGVIALRIRPRRPMLVICLLLFLWPLQLFALAAGAVALVIAAATMLGNLANATFNTIWYTTLQQHVPPAALSRVSSYEVLGTWGLQAIGTAVAGFVALAFGNEATLYIAGAVMVALAFVDLAIPSVRRLEAPVASPASLRQGET